MGNTYRNIFVQSTDEQVLRRSIVASGHAAYLLLGDTWSVIFPKITDNLDFWVNQQKFARACSVDSACVLLSCYVYDSDFLLLELWQKGECFGGYASAQDLDAPPFIGLTPARLAAAFGRPELEPELHPLLARKPSKLRLQSAVAALTKEYEGRWAEPDYREKMFALATSQQSEPPPFTFAEEQHQQLCAALGLPGEAVGADYDDVENGDANISAIAVRAKGLNVEGDVPADL